MKTDKVRVHVHTNKELACTANIFTEHERIFLKFLMLAIDKKKLFKNKDDLNQKMKTT